jgi:PAS domain S-box-containing protein
LHFRVPPEPSHLLRARERLRDYLRQYCTDRDVIDDVVLCVEEACTNAIRHGGSPDDIEIALHFAHTKLIATVKDHGRGFDVASFDPGLAPDPTSDHGRGLFIIASLMDSLELRLDGGLEVRMARRAGASCEPPSLGNGLVGSHFGDDVGRHDVRVRAVLEEIDEAFVALDWEYRYVHVNEAMLRFTQTSRDELLGRVIWDLFPQLQGSPLEAHYRQAMELGMPSVFEHRAVVTGDWLEIRIYPTSVGVSAYYREINERKRNELQGEELLVALRDSEERYRELFQSESDAILFIDQESGRVLETNVAAQAMYGYTTDELLGLTDLDLSAEPELSRRATRSAVVGATTNVPLRIHRRKDGTTFPAEVTGRVFSFRGRLVRIAAVRDVTARERAEEARGRFELLATNSRDIILFMDRGGLIIEANEAAERAYGYTHDELLELTIADLRAGQAQAEIASQMTEADERGILFESLHRRKDDSVFAVEVSSRGATVGGRRTLVSIIRDISERKRAEEALRASEQAAQRAEERYRNLFNTLIEGFCVVEMVFNADGKPVDYRFLEINQVFEERTGLHDAQGKLMRELAPDHEQHWFDFYGKVALTGQPARFMAPAGALGRFYDVSAFRVGGPESRQVGILFNDITARHRAEQERQRLLEESEAQADELKMAQGRLEQELEKAVLLSEAVTSLTESLASIEVLDKLARIILHTGGHTRVTISLWQEREGNLKVAAARGEPAVPLGLLVALDELSEPARRAIDGRKSTLIDYDALEPGHRGVGDRVTSHLSLNVPLYVGERFVGLVSTDDPGERREFSVREIGLIEDIGAHAAVALENARLHDELARRERFSTALNEINRLIHSTLKVEEIMQRVVAHAVGVVGSDSAMVALKHGDDWVAEYGHPEVPGVIHESVSSDEAPFMIAAVSTRLPVAIDDCETDPRCIPDVQRRFGVRSVLCIPLIARDEVLGVIFFNHHRAAVRFEPQTVDFAGKLAVTISSALDNARMYQEQQRIAQTLQDNFLHELPEVAGLELGVIAETASKPELVGGDFSDVFVIDDRHVVVLIGDVAGKGVRAAGMTETVRSTVRALAAVDPSPAFILGKTNELLLRFDPDEPHVTAFLAVLDPHTGHLTCASAGHPAPVHLGAFSSRLLGVEFGPPLGCFERPYASAHAMLTLDDYLVLYTDGVTEARRQGELLGEDRLLATVDGLRGRRAQEVAEGVRDAALEFAGRLRDDLQVVVLRLN